MNLPSDFEPDLSALESHVSHETALHSAPFKIQFEGQEQQYSCDEGDSLLRASLRAGLGFPYECNSGGCGSCGFELVSGEVHTVWPEAPGLSERMRRKGTRLACQTQPRSDCTVRVRSKDRSAPPHLPQRLSARLAQRTPLTRDMVEFSFDTGTPARFIAGQFALITLPGVTGDRAYSMSNLPNAEGRWSFIIKRMPTGRGSGTLFDSVQIGDEVVLDGPYGMAHLREDSPLDIVCIAGGSGISPVVSILAAAARSAAHPQRRLSLFYGGRTPADLCAQALVDRDESMRGRVECISAISDDSISPSDWPGERGFIHEVVKRHIGTPAEAQQKRYYFCGPPMMTDSVSRMLMLDYLVPPTQIHFDRFV